MLQSGSNLSRPHACSFDIVARARRVGNEGESLEGPQEDQDEQYKMC